MEVPNLPEVPAKMLEAVPEVPDRRIASDEEVVVVTVVALAQEVKVAARPLGDRTGRDTVDGKRRVDEHDKRIWPIGDGFDALHAARVDSGGVGLGIAAPDQAVELEITAGRRIIGIAEI